jgi:hypothetical protein
MVAAIAGAANIRIGAAKRTQRIVDSRETGGSGTDGQDRGY